MKLSLGAALSGLILLSACALVISAPAASSAKPSQPALIESVRQGEETASPQSKDHEVVAPAKLCTAKDSEIDCNQSEYYEYMQCVEKKRSLRKKRQALCSHDTTAQQTTLSKPGDDSVLSKCEFEHQKCVVGCKNDTDCANGCPLCGAQLASSTSPLSCVGDYTDCVANCAPGQPCETTCKSLCATNGEPNRPRGYKTVIFEGHSGSGPAHRVQVPIGIGHNITTVIKLNNNINNANNNIINLFANSSSSEGEFGLGRTRDGSCCVAVQPKSCHSTSAGPRCHHRRHKTCGSQCTSRVIHAQTRRSCNRRRSKCKTTVSYVPQPSPKCHYANQWPYVSCGGARSRRSCAGCYDHYGQDYMQNLGIPERCMSCFDGGYDEGPLYRQGPVYRPHFYHEPPCYVTGTCYPMNGYGFYAPPPIYGAPPRPWPMPMPYPEGNGRDEELPGEDDLLPGDDEYSGYEPDGEFAEEDFEKVVEKCKVVNVDDDTVIIKNCTSTELGENPYAATRVEANEAKDADEIEDVPMGRPQPYSPYYPQPTMYNPYPPAPGYGYYGPPPMNPYYPAYHVQPSPGRGHRKSKGVVRPEYYENYGTDEDWEEEERNEETVDEFSLDDEEKELLQKGFEKAT